VNLYKHHISKVEQYVRHEVSFESKRKRLIRDIHAMNKENAAPNMTATEERPAMDPEALDPVFFAAAAPVTDALPLPAAEPGAVPVPLAVTTASVYRAELALVTQFELAGIDGEYGSCPTGTVSAGCEYESVCPLTTYTPGTLMSALSHDSNSPGPVVGSTVYLDGALYAHPTRSRVCWQNPAGFAPAGSQILRQNELLPMKLTHSMTCIGPEPLENWVEYISPPIGLPRRS